MRVTSGPRETSVGFTPLADGKRWLLSQGEGHPALVVGASVVAVVAMALLLAWFVFLSVFNSPAELIYAGF